ncbi:SH3 domain protein [Dictyocaulus viviparus]|uniref:SH3 domain protein n=1 Tax=Dictyocaulus viviparus TaxID=29172 RepID=A0A0D8XP16_DICVI|nr:SH3 domain protein [Dictyocaulus viviparus]
MISAEDISANRYIPKLPAVPFEVDEDEGIAVKVEGDRILEVNGIPISDLSVDDVARILNRVDCGTVTLKLVPSDLLSASSSAVSHIYLRAQHDYNGRDDIRHPCPEVALSFSKGDILELLVCNDDHWWQARRIGSGAFAHCEDNRS